MNTYKVYTIRLQDEDNKILNKISYLTNTSKAELTRKGIKKVIEDYKKKLQISDKVIL